MQIRSFRGLGEPAWVIAFTNARERLGPDPRRALGPAATPAASTGRTRDRTRPMLQKRQKVLARAPSTRDSSQRTLAEPGKAGPHGDETTCFAAHAGRAEGVDRRASIHSFGQGRSDQAGGSADSRRNEIIMNTARSPARAALEDEAADAIGRRLARPFGGARLEAGGTRAIEIGALTYGAVRFNPRAQARSVLSVSIIHPNIRGSRYYYQ